MCSDVSSAGENIFPSILVVPTRSRHSSPTRFPPRSITLADRSAGPEMSTYTVVVLGKPFFFARRFVKRPMREFMDDIVGEPTQCLLPFGAGKLKCHNKKSRVQFGPNVCR